MPCFWVAMIKEVVDKTELPWHLLLEADPDRDIVESYLTDARVFAYFSEEKVVVGVLVLCETKENQSLEIMNISVAETHRRQGIARKLLAYAISEIGHLNQIAEIIIKTGDLTDYAIALYESVGFEIIQLVKDYFVDHYDEPIYEHGQRLRNQVVMQYKPAR